MRVTGDEQDPVAEQIRTASVVRAGRVDGSRTHAIQDSSAQVKALTPRKIFCHRTPRSASSSPTSRYDRP